MVLTFSQRHGLILMSINITCFYFAIPLGCLASHQHHAWCMLEATQMTEVVIERGVESGVESNQWWISGISLLAFPTISQLH